MTAGGASFSRHCKLTGAEAFTAVFAFKCRVSGELFHVYARPNALAKARLGILISKRDIAHSVARNYCKRLAREVFRTIQSQLPGADTVVRARVEIARAQSATARTQLRNLLRKAWLESTRRAIN